MGYRFRARLAAGLCALLLLVPATAGAFRLGRILQPMAGNPVEALDALPIEAETYEPATHCSRAARPGVVRLVAWLHRHSARGVDWGSYRCERWGKHSASLHAEGRAEDWHLDVHDPADKREARRLIELLLAPDKDGNQHALARRMGVEELIWDCSYWSSGMQDFKHYDACVEGVDPTTAHRNHVHLGLTREGAMARTSFWTRQAPKVGAGHDQPWGSGRPRPSSSTPSSRP